jgi:L-fuconolactonase
MRIDAHQHFWRYDAEAYPWIGTDVLSQDYLPQDLEPLLRATGFDGTVVVQARSTWDENCWLLSLADDYPFIKGVVGWADLSAPDLEARLAPFVDHPKFCGVRCGIMPAADDPDRPHPDFVRGIGSLTAAGLTFDLLVRPPQLPLARALVEVAPDQRFILDHVAKPRIKEQILEPWATEIRELAALPNVACKVSGMVTEADREAWRQRDFHPYLDVVFDAFGADRLMIGSDWPVCRQAASYQFTMGVVPAYVAPLSAEEKAAVLGDTAQRWYNL